MGYFPGKLGQFLRVTLEAGHIAEELPISGGPEDSLPGRFVIQNFLRVSVA